MTSMTELRDIMAQLGRTMDSVAESRKETERSLAAYRAETERMFSERMAATRAETEKALRELSATSATSREATEKAIRRMSEKIDKLSDTVTRVDAGFGTMGRRFGTLVELIVVPGVRQAINAHGHDFRRALANKIIRSGGQTTTEVDLFLHNGAEAMAVEVKAGITDKEVKDHIQQLRILRTCEKDAKIEGKALYGAVVGVSITPTALELALENGLYVLEILEEEKKLKTNPPKKCSVW